MRTTTVIFLCLANLAGCQTPSSYVEKGKPLLSRPGVVAVDVEERRKILSQLPSTVFACGSFFDEIPVFTDLDAPSGYGLDRRYTRVAKALRQAGSACLGGAKPACKIIQSAALSWAQKTQDLRPVGAPGSSKFWNDTLTINMRLLGPIATMLSVAEVVTPMNPADRAIVDTWMKSKVDSFEHGMRNEGNYEGGNSGTTARRAAHNHAAQSSIAAMSYGAWVGDEDYFRIGLEQWSITLDSMRDDGSLPIETRRGARALYYHGRTISALVQIAERARVQGIDLYGKPPWGIGSIHHAVAFFINAVINPTIVLPYAKTNHVPGPSKDYTRQHLGGRGTLGWIAPYMARFPKHPNTLRLRTINGSESYLTPGVEMAVLGKSGSSEWIGVDARCFYADFDDDF